MRQTSRKPSDLEFVSLHMYASLPHLQGNVLHVISVTGCHVLKGSVESLIKCYLLLCTRVEMNMTAQNSYILTLVLSSCDSPSEHQQVEWFHNSQSHCAQDY